MELGNHEQTLATIVVTGAVQITINILNQYRESQKAKREREATAASVRAKLEEERLHIARELAMKMARIESQARAHAEELKRKIDENKAKIEENTEISVKAFDVANHVNEKIVSIQEASKAMLKDHIFHAQQDRIEAKAEDIQHRVINIEDKITPSSGEEG